jgi:hypothetical protein
LILDGATTTTDGQRKQINEKRSVSILRNAGRTAAPVVHDQ